MPTPVDYSAQESQREVYTLDQSDPLFRHKTYDRAAQEKSAGKAVITSSQPKPAPKPQAADLPASFYEANGENYLRARRLAEMKFNTIKLTIAYVFTSALLAMIDYATDPAAWWCFWPIGLWGFVIAFPFTKTFLLHGKDLRQVIDSRLHRMALREVEKYDCDL